MPVFHSDDLTDLLISPVMPDVLSASSKCLDCTLQPAAVTLDILCHLSDLSFMDSRVATGE